ncbi:hypothetical protein Ato02nite_074900 [Paractinoplanes toevensis]|uniref:Uncharacterized protein n=1 Tax=Paractinoplanes toevensis TaxID=571911 RepID=A0A919TI82_9ACTN|nr:hypothetical protein Ato02nite_074900 [Actinoplanes toevensis]
MLLPGRPNGLSGWIDTELVGIITARYDLRVQLGEGYLYVRFCGRSRRWPLTVRDSSPAVPLGRTYVLAGPAGRRTEGLLLAAHHGDAAGNVQVGGERGSGTFIVPAAALPTLARVEPGTMVLIRC